MKSAFLVAWRGLWRGRTLWTLLAAVIAIHFFLPGIVRSDGTDSGSFEMLVRIVCGAVHALVCVASLSIGAGMFARERENDTLPLSLVRPASVLSVAAGRWMAIVLLFACVIIVNAALLNATVRKNGFSPPDCRLHIAPSLPSAEKSAALVMDRFLNDERTPEAVRKSSRASVLALLVAKENERYEVIRPGQSVTWPFPEVTGDSIAVRTRFSTMFGMKTDMNGVFRYNGAMCAVSNSTQAVIEAPLVPDSETNTNRSHALSFTNTGNSDVMLRPRRDVEMLAPGDSFVANSIRASMEMLALSGLLAAFGLFLSSALSRPVALFTASVLLAAAMMAPDAVAQFPDEFNATVGEKVGLAVSRAVIAFTSAVDGISPVSDLSSGRMIVSDDVIHAVVFDLIVFPSLLLALAAVMLRRKTK